MHYGASKELAFGEVGGASELSRRGSEFLEQSYCRFLEQCARTPQNRTGAAAFSAGFPLVYPRTLGTVFHPHPALRQQPQRCPAG